MRLTTLIATLLCAVPLSAGDLAVESQAKFLKLFASSTGVGKVACSDGPLKAALQAQGVTIDDSSPIIYCSNPMQAKMAKASNKLVVTGSRAFMNMVCIVLEEADGRPKIILNTSNLHTSKVQLSDAVLKMAEKM